MRIFVDVNVFMDVLTRRRGWKASLVLLQLVRMGKIEGYISALTVPVIYFLRARIFNEEKAREDTRKIVAGFKIVPLSGDLIAKSLEEKRIKDFEDSIQFHSARISSEIFVTRNIKDFKGVRDEIELLTPEEFLEKYERVLGF